MKLPIPVICECGFATMDAKKAIEHTKEHERKEVLIVENVQIDVGTLHDAMLSHVLVTRDKARNKIVEAIIKGLDTRSTIAFELYMRQNNPCLEEE